MKRNEPKQQCILDDENHPVPANKNLVKKSVVIHEISKRGVVTCVQKVIKCTHKNTNKFSGVHDPKNYKKKANKQ